MPVPQENSSFVEQASCLFLKMLQDVSYTAGFLFPMSIPQEKKIVDGLANPS
ncbi:MULTISPECIES: hypothetical protein [unclassified Microcoleus]|uniref:hypothetical protein n=1 Tax=unclassified Microcoleus TaxID=2642155 RepID=UPI0025FF7D4B|nr:MULTISPECIES: hypothetical protein [unclassified Microcoleus]